MSYVFGQEIARDPFDTPITIGSLIFVPEYYNGQIYMTHGIVIGHTNKSKSNVRLLTPYMGIKGELKTGVGWQPEYKLFVYQGNPEGYTSVALREYAGFLNDQRLEYLHELLKLLTPEALVRYQLDNLGRFI